MKNVGMYILVGIALVVIAALAYFTFKSGGNNCCDRTPVAYGTINNIGQGWGFGGGPIVNWHSQSISLPSARYEVSFDDFCYRVNTHMALVTPINSPDNDQLVSIRTDADNCKLIIIMERPELNRTPGHDDWSIYNELLFTPVAFAVFEL